MFTYIYVYLSCIDGYVDGRKCTAIVGCQTPSYQPTNVPVNIHKTQLEEARATLRALLDAAAAVYPPVRQSLKESSEKLGAVDAKVR